MVAVVDTGPPGVVRVSLEGPGKLPRICRGMSGPAVVDSSVATNREIVSSGAAAKSVET